MKNITGVVFDKDGTLFDFQASWGHWAARFIEALTRGDDGLRDRVADAMSFDRATSRFRPDSIVIAETSHNIASALAPLLQGRQSVADIEDLMNVQAADTKPTPVLDLAAYLADLRKRGLALGVVTNDAEVSARAHLAAERIEGAFDFIAGYDSGFGAKPDPGPLLAFCAATGCDPTQTLMVGDSLHDLMSGRAAGMKTLGVLTGVADRGALSPFADVVLPDIGHLPSLL